MYLGGCDLLALGSAAILIPGLMSREHFAPFRCNRMIGIWLGMRWEDKVYVDKVQPFVLRSAPIIYNAVANALLWLLAMQERVNAVHSHFWGTRYTSVCRWD